MLYLFSRPLSALWCTVYCFCPTAFGFFPLCFSSPSPTLSAFFAFITWFPSIVSDLFPLLACFLQYYLLFSIFFPISPQLSALFPTTTFPIFPPFSPLLSAPFPLFTCFPSILSACFQLCYPFSPNTTFPLSYSSYFPIYIHSTPAHTIQPLANVLPH